MSGSRARFSLTEYGAPLDLGHLISGSPELEHSRVAQVLAEAGDRIAKTLNIRTNPITIDSRGVRAVGFAGLIRLSPSLELEVAPKFLGRAENDSGWREDFFFLATLSRHGRLLARERLAASGGAPKDLSTLVARAIIGMYETRKRRPLRTYRRVKEADFFIDGDLDPVELSSPGPDGFEQEIMRFDRQNQWNAVFHAAASELLPIVSDPIAAAGLVRLIEDISPQNLNRKKSRKRIPSRHQNWRPLYDLSIDVLNGLGVNYNAGQAHVPGYVVSTWQIWEDLLTIAARLGFGREAVSPQKGFVLGAREKLWSGPEGVPISVFPDCVVEGQGKRPRFLLDAKYKGHIEKGGARISESDTYEALAFSRAADCNLIVLAYPALSNADKRAIGECSVFEQIRIGEIRIIGVHIEVRGISASGALMIFSATLAEQLSKIIS